MLKGIVINQVDLRSLLLQLNRLIRHPEVVEESDQFVFDGSKIWPLPEKVIDRAEQQRAFIDGRIGCPAFESSVCFIDLFQSLFVISSDLIEMKGKHRIERYIEVPFRIEKGLVVIEAETDGKKKSLLLDTGATVSILKKAPNDQRIYKTIGEGLKKYRAKQCAIAGKNFGKFDFYLIL